MLTLGHPRGLRSGKLHRDVSGLLRADRRASGPNPLHGRPRTASRTFARALASSAPRCVAARANPPEPRRRRWHPRFQKMTAPNGSLRVERARASAQFADGFFKNPNGAGPRLDGPSLPVIGEFLFRRGRREPKAPIPIERPHEVWTKRPSTGFRATWLGHSTVLLEIDGRRVLTDPVFAERVSPVTFAGPKRFHPVPARFEELPPLDAVLLSPDHFDHLC